MRRKNFKIINKFKLLENERQLNSNKEYIKLQQ